MIGENTNFIEMENKLFYAGIVLYNPENEIFIKSIDILLKLNIKVIVYDNSTIEKCIDNNQMILNNLFGTKILLLKSSSGNVGLGKSFNDIVKKAMGLNNCKGIYLFDQDSEVNEQALNQLNTSFNDLSIKNHLGIIAAYAVRQKGNPYRLRTRKLNLVEKKNIVNVNQVPSSFSLIPVSTFEKIGLFNEDFFIDHIDMDFSMRCWENNLPVYVNKNAKFIHNVGLGDVIIFGYHLFPISHEYRHYYQVRNHILSLKINKKPYIVIIKEVLIRIIIVFIISMYKGSFFKRFKYLFKGIYHGFNGISGKLAH